MIGIVTPDQENPAKTVGSPHPDTRIPQAKLVANTLCTVSSNKRVYTIKKTVWLEISSVARWITYRES